MPKVSFEAALEAKNALPSVHFDFRWLGSAQVRDSAKKATFAELEIRVGEVIVTGVAERLPMRRDFRHRKYVMVPLVSVAEWLARNWWHFWYELPGLDDQRPGFESRHDLAHAGEGFLLPRLEIVRDAERMRLQWSKRKSKHSDIQFVAEGQAEVSREALEAEFRTLIEAVLERVGSLLRGTENCESLRAAWDAVNSLGRREVEFAQAAAILGEDPFHMQDSVAKAMVEFWAAFPPSIREEALAGASPESLSSVSEWLNDSLARLEESYDGMRWAAVREAVEEDLSNVARGSGRFRADLVRSLLDVGRRFDFEPSGTLAVPLLESAPPSKRIQGLVDAHSPACIGVPTSGNDKRHMQARALGDYIGRTEPVPGILTSLATARQAFSSAFADQLLAPAQVVRDLLPVKRRNDETINEVARDFGVSTAVIRRQLRAR